MNEPISPRTVIEAFLPPTGSVTLAHIYDAANAVGIEDQTLRLAIRRMAAGGELEQHGRGRAGSLTPTERGLDKLHRDQAGLRLAAGQDDGSITWDHRWHLTAISAPERDRSIRDSLRRELLAAGAATISTGLFVSPHDLTGTVTAPTAHHRVDATVTHLDVRGVCEPEQIAEQLWPAAPIVAAYAVVTTALHDDNDSISATIRTLTLAHALEQAIRHDPLIPPELRASPWAPTALRNAWAERWQSIVDDEGPLPFAAW